MNRQPVVAITTTKEDILGRHKDALLHAMDDSSRDSEVDSPGDDVHMNTLLMQDIGNGRPKKRKLCRRSCLWWAFALCCCAAWGAALILLFVPYDGSDAIRRVMGGEAYPDDPFWHKHAARLRNMSDARANPCKDFYQHVCGGWLKDNQLDPDVSSVGMFDEIVDTIKPELLEVVSEGWPYVGTWWDACTDVDSRRANGKEALLPLLEMASNVASSQQLASTLAILHASGINALFTMDVMPDERDPTRPALVIDYPMMGAPRSVWQSNSTVGEQQRQALADLVTALLENSDDQAQQALSVERDWLAPAQLLPADRRGRAMEWIALDTLPSRAFDWNTYWQHTLGTDTLPAELAMIDTSYLNAVEDTLESVPWHKVRSYLQYTVMMTYAHALPNASALLAPLRKATTGAGPQTLQSECLASTSQAFPTLLGHHYVHSYFSASAKETANALVQSVLEAMGELLASNEWMDVATRTHALSKLSAILPMIGYPDKWPTNLPPFYVVNDDHLDNEVTRETTMVLLNWARLSWTSLPSQPGWDMPVYKVNAYYDPLQNDIVFPAGILQGGFFNASAPLSANYGGIGMVTGHEVSHGFDDEGRHYDADGSRSEWWTPASSAEFDRRASCVSDLYSSFSTPYGSVNGNLTLGENLADIGGLKVSYKAYQNVLEKDETWINSSFDSRKHYERHLEAVYGYSADQLFFRSWGAVWCGKRSPQRATELLSEDPHSPPRWRVNGPASQSEDFARAFQCTPPQDPCKLW